MMLRIAFRAAFAAIAWVGVAQAQLVATPSPLGFFQVPVGTESTKVLTLQNVGSVDVVVLGATLRPNGTAPLSAEFAVATPPLPLAIAPGASAEASVTYSPVDAGTDSAALDIATNDPATPTTTVGLYGSGLVPLTTFDVDITGVRMAWATTVRKPIFLAVGYQCVGPLGGTFTVTVTGVQNGAQVYAASQAVATVPGAYGMVEGFKFTPKVPGLVTWTVSITDGDPDADLAIAESNVTSK
jgi:hypothetical protein